MKWFDAGTKTLFIRLMKDNVQRQESHRGTEERLGPPRPDFGPVPFRAWALVGLPSRSQGPSIRAPFPPGRGLHQEPLPGLPSRRALLALRTPPLAARARADPPFQAARDPRSFSRLLPTAATSAHHRGPELCPASDVSAAAPLGRAINPTRGNPMLSPLLLRCCTVFIPHCCTVFLPHCCTVFLHHCGTVF